MTLDSNPLKLIDPDFPMGTNGQVLVSDDTITEGIKWASPSSLSTLTTKGDILTHNGAAESRLPVGTDGQTIVADSSQALGVRWATTSGNTPFAVNSGMTNGYGQADFIQKIDNGSIKVLATSVESNNQPTLGKDLKVSFDGMDARDDYGLHTVTTIGSPLYTNGKFNSNGATGLVYPITSMGSGSWCIQGKFNFTNMATAQALIEKYLSGNVGFVLRRLTTGLSSLYISSNNASWNITSGAAGTKVYANTTEYYIRLRFTGTQYLVDWSTDGSTWTNDITVTSSLICSSTCNISFGYSVGDSSFPLVGTMDDLMVTVGSPIITPKILSIPNLVQTDVKHRQYTMSADSTISGITTNGSHEVIQEFGLEGIPQNPVALLMAQQGKDLWVDFSRGDATDNYRLNNPIVYGSPTFTDNKFNSNGVTGLKYPSISNMGNTPWCIQCLFKSTSTTTSQAIFNGINGSTAWSLCVEKNTANKLALYMSSNSSTYTIANTTGIKADWSISTEYYIRLRFTGTQYLLDWSLDGTTWTNDITITSSLTVYAMATSPLCFGLSGYNSAIPFLGTIDDISVTIGSPTVILKSSIQELPVLPQVVTDGSYVTITRGQPMRQFKGIGGVWVETAFNKLGAFDRTLDTIGTPISYAFNGLYTSPDVTIVGVSNVTTSYTHNLGTLSYASELYLRCYTPTDGFIVGDIIRPMVLTYQADPWMPMLPVPRMANNSVAYSTGEYAGSPYYGQNTTGSARGLFTANWKQFVVARRNY